MRSLQVTLVGAAAAVAVSLAAPWLLYRMVTLFWGAFWWWVER